MYDTLQASRHGLLAFGTVCSGFCGLILDGGGYSLAAGDLISLSLDEPRLQDGMWLDEPRLQDGMWLPGCEKHTLLKSWNYF